MESSCHPEAAALLQEQTTREADPLSLPVSPLIACTATHERGKNSSVHATRSADFWSIQYQYAAFVAASPQLDATHKDIWTRAMQYAYGKYIASIKASLHPRVVLAVSHEIDRLQHDMEAELLDTAADVVTRQGNELSMSAAERNPQLDKTLACGSAQCRLPQATTGVLSCTVCRAGFHANCINAHFEGALGRYNCVEHDTCRTCSNPSLDPVASSKRCYICSSSYHTKCVSPDAGLELSTVAPTLPNDASPWVCDDCCNCATCGDKLPATSWHDYALWTTTHLERPGELPRRLCSGCKTNGPHPPITALHCKVCNLEWGRSFPALSIRSCGSCHDPVHARCMMMTEQFPTGICIRCRKV